MAYSVGMISHLLHRRYFRRIHFVCYGSDYRYVRVCIWWVWHRWAEKFLDGMSKSAQPLPELSVSDSDTCVLSFSAFSTCSCSGDFSFHGTLPIILFLRAIVVVFLPVSDVFSPFKYTALWIHWGFKFVYF